MEAVDMNNAHEPATRQDLADFRNELVEAIQESRTITKNDIGAVRNDIKNDLRTVRDEVIQAIAGAETRVLKAFYTFAEANQKRVAGIESGEMAMRSRIGSIETRLLEVEKRLNMPPQA